VDRANPGKCSQSKTLYMTKHVEMSLAKGTLKLVAKICSQLAKKMAKREKITGPTLRIGTSNLDCKYLLQKVSVMLDIWANLIKVGYSL